MAFDATSFEVDPLTITEPKERLRYLADFLRRLPEERFNMAYPGGHADARRGFCGSPSCIGGWARAVFRREGTLIDVGTEALGLSVPVADRLFFPMYEQLGDGEHPFSATAAEAAVILDHLRLTGEVDWSVARKVEA